MEKGIFNDNDRIELRKLFMLLWSRKYLILSIVLAMALLAGVYNLYFQTPVYRVEATIQLGNLETDVSNMDTAVRLLKSSNFINLVNDDIEMNYTDDELQNYLEKNISLSMNRETKIIDIAITDTYPELAKKILTGVIVSYKQRSDSEYNEILSNRQEYLESIKENISKLDKQIEEINNNIESITDSSIDAVEKSILIGSLTNSLNPLFVQKNNLILDKRTVEEETFAVNTFQILQDPYILANPVSPDIKENVALAVVFGLIVAILLIFLLEFVNFTGTKKKDQDRNNR